MDISTFVLRPLYVDLVFWLYIFRLFSLSFSSPTGYLCSDVHSTRTSCAPVPSPAHHLGATHTQPSFVTTIAGSAVVTPLLLPSPISHHNSCMSVAQQLSPPTSVATSTIGGPEFAGADATTLLRRATAQVWARERETDTLPNGTSSPTALYGDSDGALSQRVIIEIIVCLMIFIAIVLSFYYFGSIWSWCQGSSPLPPPPPPRRSRSLKVTASILMNIVSEPAVARFPLSSGVGVRAGTRGVARPVRGHTTETAEDDELALSRLSFNTASTFVADQQPEQADLDPDNSTPKAVDRRSTFSSMASSLTASGGSLHSGPTGAPTAPQAAAGVLPVAPPPVVPRRGRHSHSHSRPRVPLMEGV